MPTSIAVGCPEKVGKMKKKQKVAKTSGGLNTTPNWKPNYKVWPAPDEHILTSTGIKDLYEMIEAEELSGTPDDGRIYRQALWTKAYYMKQGIELPEIEKKDRLYISNWLIKSQGVIDKHKPDLTMPLSIKQWRTVFGMTKKEFSELRKKKKSIYHFYPISEKSNRLVLPIQEMPANVRKIYNEIVAKNIKTALSSD